jgi:2,3-bisphosphoglycerate-independent phosphoglycerate mutase
MNIGSGRVLMQELPRIDSAIAEGTIAQNKALVDYIQALKRSGGTCHIMGLLSPGGVHSHQRHMAELARLVSAQGVPVKLHAFLDGRDTPPQSALGYMAQFRKDFPVNDFVTVSGRYYAMDRDKRWERVQKVYDVLVQGGKAGYRLCEEAIEASYKAGVNDEFLVPTILGDPDTHAGYGGMHDGDGILMTNFRADRAREILEALLDPAFSGFTRKRTVRFAAALGLVEYSTDLNRFMKAMFTPEPLRQILGEVIAAKGLKQLRIAETEKYAHVTFFFNGGCEEPFAGEERILVPSPKVATYDLKPEMSAFELTEKLVQAIDKGTFDFIVVNYANCDMVGHTGDLKAAVKAVETVDACTGKVWEAVKRAGGAMIITADHGNAEQMFDETTHQAHTAHTLNLVPVIVASAACEGRALKHPEGKLADIAPTVLALMGIDQPEAMTGQSLL